MKYLLMPALLGLTLSATASELDGHAAHQHGVAHLTIALEGQILVMELESPADNVTGFEHAPRKPGEKAAVAAAVASLRRSGLLLLNGEAQCTQVKARANNPFAAAGGSAHADFDASYTFSCRSPEKLVLLDARGLLKTFPRMKTLNVDYALPGTQGSLELTSVTPTARLVR